MHVTAHLAFGRPDLSCGVARARVLRRTYSSGSERALEAATPRDDVVGEVALTPDRFGQSDGPFHSYERVLHVEGDRLIDTTTYELDIPWFRWLFGPLMRRALIDRRAADAPKPFWAPPDRITARQAHLLGLLAAAAMSAAFANTLFTQTVKFAVDDFGISKTGQSVGGVIVRLGIVIAIPFAVLADRVGRRRVIVMLAWLTPICCALGAISPTFWVLVGTQTVGRPLGIALAFLVTVAATEDMPRNSRAYALSVLALASGLGAGIAVMALPLAGLGDSGWRLIYVVSLIWLLVAASNARSLTETRRFEAVHAIAPPLPRRRFAVVGIVAVTSNLFIAPASFFQNTYLTDVRGFNSGDIALFTLSTATPASIGLIVGGRLADAIGRRVVIAVCVPLSTFVLAGSFAVGGPAMWLGAFAGGVTAGLAYPALAVYRAELFPTGNRGRANGLVTALSLAGGSIGLIAVGSLVDHGWSYGSAMFLLAIGQLIAAAIAVFAYPETAHMELEQLNPEDAPLTA